MNEVDELLLEHFGTKGMKWGVRRAASKDAKEHERARLFYGEGAGTRRKLIKAKVEGRSKRDPAYKSAFEEHLAKQDSSKHASKAVGERKRADTKKRTKQRAGALARTFTGEMGTQAAFVALAVGGVAFMSSPKGQALMYKGFDKINNSRQSRAGAKLVSDFLKQGR